MENILRSLIVLKGKTIPEVAKEMGISKNALYRKICGKSEFTRREISALVSILDIETYKAMEIFFNLKVS